SRGVMTKARATPTGARAGAPGAAGGAGVAACTALAPCRRPPQPASTSTAQASCRKARIRHGIGTMAIPDERFPLRHVPPVLWVERVAQAVTQEVEAQERHRERDAGKDHEPGKEREQPRAVRDQRAPRCGGGLDPEPQEREERAR